MSDYTSIQISKDTKEKLDLCKGLNNLSYNKIIERLLEQSGGVIVEDVVEIQREQTAFSLKYWDSSGVNKIRDISYAELKESRVDMDFEIDVEPAKDVDFVNAWATVKAIDGSDVILLVSEVSRRDGVVSSIKSVVHISLF